jgi:hypothetical protein
MTLVTIAVKPLDALIFVFAFFAVLLFALSLLGIGLAIREKLGRQNPKGPLAAFLRRTTETKESDPYFNQEFEIQPDVLAEEARRYTMGDLAKTPPLNSLYVAYAHMFWRRKRPE